MKTKMSTKLISAVLAFCVAISCTFSAFAAESYTATYTEKATKDVYSTILEDANELIGDAALTGATIQSIYAIVPNLKPVLPEAIKADFYKAADADVFAGLDEFMTANAHKDVTPDVLNAYFAENPITVKDSADFTAKLKTVINAIITPNVFSTVVLVVFMGCQMTPSIGEAGIPDFTGYIDGICKALGVEQEKALFEILSSQDDGNVMLSAYINNIIDGLLPDLSNNVVGIMQNIADDKNNALLYNSLTNLFNKLSDMIGAFGPMIGMLVPGLDIAPIQKPIDDIKNTINKLPTVGEGDAKRFDYEGTIAYLVNDVLAPQITQGSRFDVISFDKESKGALKLDKFNLANLVSAKDETDAFNVIFNYLYNNLNKAENSSLLSGLIPMIPVVAPQLPKDVVDYLDFVLNNTKEDSVFQLYALLRIATGHSSDMGEVVPAEPVPVDPEKPVPVDPEKPVDPKPAPTKPDTKGDRVNDPKLPNTGLVEEGVSMTTMNMVVVGTAGLALVVLAIVAKKRGLFNA